MRAQPATNKPVEPAEQILQLVQQLLQQSERSIKGTFPLQAMLAQEKKVQHVKAFGDEPCSYQEAINFSKQDLWEEAMRNEMLLLKANNTWSLKKLSHDWKALLSKWVFKKKIKIDKKVAQYKARWVVRGLEQHYRLDYNQTFASMVKPMSYKIIFSLAAICD